MNGIILEVTGLCKRYKDRDVLKNVSFRLEEGSAAALIGPQGAGRPP